MTFPLSVACVERFFSKQKLVKTRLKNQLSQTTLEWDFLAHKTNILSISQRKTIQK